MKKAIVLFCAALWVLGSVLPLAGYYSARAAAGRPAAAPSSALPDGGTDVSFSAPEEETAPEETVLLRDSSTGQNFTLTLREYLIGAVASEMPVSWPDEALKAQTVACHSYLLYCRDHRASGDDPWRTVDPARRQGCMTEAVLRSYWGTAYDSNYARMAGLVDAVMDKILYYGGAPAGTSYFAISNGRTESSENVWGAALPYLVPVESDSDRNADNYQYTVRFSPDQMRNALTSQLGINPGDQPPAEWFGGVTTTSSGYIASMSVCGQAVRGTDFRSALGLRSACFTVTWQDGGFTVTTLGYGHGVGLSQWGAKALAEAGQSWDAILAHYFPGTSLTP